MDSNRVPPLVEDEDKDDAASVASATATTHEEEEENDLGNDDDETEFDDDEMIAEIEAERAAAAAAAVAAPAVRAVVKKKRSWQEDPNFAMMNLSDKSPQSQSKLKLIEQLKRRDEMLLRQMDISPKMRAKLIGRSGLTQKTLVKLGIDVEGPIQSLHNFREISGKMGRRVHGKNVRDVVEIPRFPRLTNPMTLDELYDYIRIGREKRERHEPLVTLLPQRVGFFTRKNKLQEEMDDLKRILREKTAEIFQLERIHFATGNPHQQMQWGNQQYRQNRALPLADRRQSTIIEDRKLAEKFSEEELTILTQQCQELRSRINELETKIRNRDPSCVINGGKTKSKHTKSKHTKSKYTKSKYTKSKKTKRRNRKYSKRN